MSLNDYIFTVADITRIGARLDKLGRILNKNERQILLFLFALAAEELAAKHAMQSLPPGD